MIAGLLVMWVLGLPACRGGATGPYAPQSEALRNPLEAQRLTMKAAELLAEEAARGNAPEALARAESLLREALTADLYCGPAHNNLGVVFLRRAMLYEAASEFQWSAKLLPGAPDPRVNLAITLERAGRTDDALDAYRTALEVYPEHIEAMQGLVRLQLRRDRADADTPRVLREIALRGTTIRWREWAQAQLARRG